MSVLRLNQDVVITKADNSFSVKFKAVVEYNIRNTYKELTATATLTLPTSLKSKNRDLLSVIQKGDKIVIRSAYFPDELTNDFEGFITSIQPKTPLIIGAEDSMYLLKKKMVSYSGKNVMLSELLLSIFSDLDIQYNFIDTNIGTIRISNTTVAGVLQELRDTYGFVSFFRDNVLYIGFPSLFPEINNNYRLTMSGINCTVTEDSLAYVYVDQRDVIIQGTSISDDNTKITTYAFYDASGKLKTSTTQPDISGSIRTFFYYNLTQQTLTETVKTQLENFLYEGYTGSVTTFLKPKIKVGDNVTIVDPRFPEREGTYDVVGVDIILGFTSGGRQVIQLGKRLT